MKKTFTFMEEKKCLPFHSCPRCNGIMILGMEQIEPATDKPWHVECAKCHLDTEDYESEYFAWDAWDVLRNNYDGEEWHGEA